MVGSHGDVAETALPSNGACGIAQHGADSTLQQGPEQGPVLDDALVAHDLAVQPVQHLLYQGCHHGTACMQEAVSR